MWQAILVDDEEFVRAELAALFPWNRYRFELAGEAEDARGAMELIEAKKPDLVITDIRMPEMDGLELISWLGTHHPHITAAVVSAYNDFPFVREALRLGAVDYLIKAEATDETAGAFLERIGGILDHRYATRRKQEKFAANLAGYRRLALESFWRDLLTRASGETEIKSRAQQLGIVLEQTWFGLVFIHVSNYQAESREGQTGCRTALEAEIRALWDWNWSWSLIDFKRGDFVIIASGMGESRFRGAPPGSDPALKLQEIARRFAPDAAMKRTTSASTRVSSFSDLPENFREVWEINLLRLYHREGRYFTADDLARLRQEKPPNLTELLAAWERVLRSVEPEAIHDYLVHVFKNILPQSLCPVEARSFALDLIHTLRRIVFEHQIRWEETGNRESDFLEMIDQAESIDDWQSRIEKLVGHYLEAAKAGSSPQVSIAIQKALVYIQSNFTRDLSQEEVAAHVGVNKSYLSRVFPEYTGEHFSDHLQRLRIERAKELLRFTNDHIYEIAAKVGFWNPRYFSKIFHKAVGVTPADYRRIPQELKIDLTGGKS